MSECIYPCIQQIVNVNIDVFWTNSECIYQCIQQIVNVYIHVFWTNGVRCNAIPPHSHPQLDFHHFAITFQMDRRGNCDYISNGSGQGLPSFFDLKFLFF